MARCSTCGTSNPDGAKFCSECGTPLVRTSEEHRKVVTVLFCDVVGSTALGERVDPEVLRALLARYFERMSETVERHGGTVEKFVGDAVMAVFGVPAAHEDDALRACRAASAMRDAFPELGIHGRIGVNTGEVVTGTQERLATGDAVNVTARLQQAAAPNEILVGATTMALVGSAVEAEPVEPLALKGKAAGVAAFRLVAVRAAAERSYNVPFVGREQELALIREAWARANVERRCALLTIVADAGVGKSRLVSEAAAALGVRTVSGRCLPYGDGITYWPVVEVLRQLGTLPSDPAAAASIQSLLGESTAPTSAEEIAWAFRKALEEAAPVLAIFDDIHSGEETFLDLVEGAALLSTGAPVLLICIARTELLDKRPTWPVALRLEPLADRQVEELIGNRAPGELRTRIARAAGGNPLFVEEMLAMAGDHADDVSVPPSLQALLSARLDQLDTRDRHVLERASVEGEHFHRGAVQTLTPDEPHVIARLAALVRRSLVAPEQAQLAGEDGFRFRHVLVRDAAYEALPKALRADLHERFAGWLEQRAPDLVELDEILGYHLEQATHYKDELGCADPALADRASERLAAAGRRALWRGDDRAARRLLERALELTRAVRLDVRGELDLAEAYGFSDPPRAAAVAGAAAERARQSDDATSAALAATVAAYYGAFTRASTVEAVGELAQTALPLLEEARDYAGLVNVWNAIAFAVANGRFQYREMAEACEQALRNTRLAGQPRATLFWLELALVNGPFPADDALRMLDEALSPHPHPAPLLHRAYLLAMLGRFEQAWPVARAASAKWRELSGCGGEYVLAEIAALAGDHEAAVGYLRAWCDWTEEQGNTSILSTYAPELGRELCALGRHEEAEPLAKLGRQLCEPGDVATELLWRQAQALVDAHRGELGQAERLAREAIAIAERTDALIYQALAWWDLADVLHAGGRTAEAAAALEQALERYERKRNWAMVRQVRPRLEALREAALT